MKKTFYLIYLFIFYASFSQSHEEGQGIYFNLEQIEYELVAEWQASPTVVRAFLDIQEGPIASFFNENLKHLHDSVDLKTYTNQLKKSLETSFIPFKAKYTSLIKTSPAPAEVNGPCNNIDFETGTNTGWEGHRARACTTSLVPCNQTLGFSPTRHVVTDNTIIDPFIPTLSTVAPGGNHSMRIEDYASGRDAGLTNLGNAATVRQTFRVGPTNNLFTYQYAAVLEDPGDHQDGERPYFKVRMYDEAGDEIDCASYTVIAKPPLQNFSRAQVTNPNRTGNDARMDLYYRNWTTVSIPLTAFMGQNVTVVFMASDCSRGGHMAYAYVDAKCAEIKPPQDTTICGDTPKILRAPDGFSAYNWTGPGIIGVRNQQTISFNRPGNYVVTLTPFSDDPCPITMTYTVKQVCPTPPIKDTLCETVKGSGQTRLVNLNTYNLQAIDGRAGVTVRAWYRDRVQASNLLNPATQVTVGNGIKYYAVTTFPDTVELSFLINGKPNITIPSIPPACEGSTPFQITGVLPSGGIFKGTYISNTGRFNPSLAGTHTFSYTFTNSFGCIDSSQQTVTVAKPATINIPAINPLCATSTTVNIAGTSTFATSVSWSGGQGSFQNANRANTIYTPTQTEKNSGSPVQLILKGNAENPCPAVQDTLLITFVLPPTAVATDIPKLCANIDSVAISATATHTTGTLWTGGNGRFKDASLENTFYYPTTAEKNGSAPIILTIKASATTPCTAAQDQTQITFVPLATITASPISTICNSTDSISLSAISQNTTQTLWTGGQGTFKNASAKNTYYHLSATEKSSGNPITFIIKGDAASPCPAVADTQTLNIVKATTVSAQDLVTVCNTVDSVILSGTAQNATATAWSGGTGTFGNVANLQTSYRPSATEKTSSNRIIFTLTAQALAPCPQTTDTISLKIVPAATITASALSTICNTSDSIYLSAVSQYTTQTLWTGGQGTFKNASALNTLYHLSTSEKNAGSSITFIIKGDAASPCVAVADTQTLNIVKAATVTAQDLSIVCNTVDSIALSGNAQNATSTIWSGGTGTFGNVDSLQTSYQPSATEKASSSRIVFTLRAQAQAPCPEVTDTISFKILPQPSLDLADSPAICATDTNIKLTWTQTNAQSLVWTTHGGTLKTLSANTGSYAPTALEKADTSIFIYVQALGYPPCPSVKDSIEVKVITPPTVTLSPLANICADTDTITLTASSNHAPQHKWQGGQGGTFSQQDSASTLYLLSATDKASSKLVFTFTGQATTPCKAVSDSTSLNIVPLPKIATNILNKFCEDVDTIAVRISGEHLTSITWSGNGSFADASQPATSYRPTQAERDAGIAKLQVVGQATAPCGPINDSLQIEFVPQPKVDLLPITAICADANQIQLQSTSTHATSLQWYGGRGNFNTTTSNNATYTLHSSEQKLQKLLFRVMARAQAPCVAVEDTAWLRINPLPQGGNSSVTFCNDDDASITLDAGPAAKYQWIGFTDSSRYLAVKQAMNYQVEIKNIYGCSALKSIDVLTECPPRLFISNAFSPNKDGSNDKYTVYGVHIGAFHMLIFNRWGEIIFESKNMYDVWDGDYRSEPMPIGVYEWVITYEGDSEKYRGPYKMKGSVTVVR